MAGSARPARHEVPEIDAAALEAARAADQVLAAAEAAGSERWAQYFRRVPDALRDETMPALRAVARTARSAYGPKDSVRDALVPDVTEPFLDAIDRLLRVIARWEAHRRADG